MTIPTGLKARGLEAYSNAVATLQAIGEDPSLYVETLARYAHACDSEQTALDAWELDGRPMHAVGSTGALVAHPIAKAFRDAQIHAAALAKTLGLSPEARAAMGRAAGRQPGQSQAPDRKPGLRRAA